MDQYIVTGMSCAACQARVEKAVSAVPGVESVSVSLLTNSMGVTGSAAPAEIIRAVEKAGYGASVKGADKAKAAGNSLSSFHGGFVRYFIGRFISGALCFAHFTCPLSTVKVCPLTTTGPT